MQRGVVEKVVYGGQGIVRKDGLVIFVDDVLPNEEISFEIVQQKKNYARAKLLTVITKSPDRAEPKCPHFGICGGCQLQHIAYNRQLELKVSWLKETLERLAKIPLQVPISAHASKTPYGYRKKITLHAKEGKVGYVARDGKLFNVKCCPIFMENETALFEELKKFQNTDITVFKDPFVIHTDKMQPMTMTLLVDGIECSYDPDVFIQNDPDHFVQVYKTVISKIEALLCQGAILDLYCGIGILSLLLAKKGYKVSGIEYNEKAIEYAKEACERNGITVSFFADQAENFRRYSQKNKIVIVNPPRVGLSDKMKQEILKDTSEYIFYISCEPSTLARDLKQLCQKYQIESLDLFDMFSQTKHFETVVCLRKI